MGGLGHSGELSVSVAARKPKDGWSGEGEGERKTEMSILEYLEFNVKRLNYLEVGNGHL